MTDKIIKETKNKVLVEVVDKCYDCGDLDCDDCQRQPLRMWIDKKDVIKEQDNGK